MASLRLCCQPETVNIYLRKQKLRTFKSHYIPVLRPLSTLHRHNAATESGKLLNRNINAYSTGSGDKLNATENPTKVVPGQPGRESFYDKKFYDVEYTDDKDFCYGFSQDDPALDRFLANTAAALGSLFIVSVLFVFNYSPYKSSVPWCKREALILLAEREEHCVPPIPKYYVDPKKLADSLPDWDELTGWEQKMLLFDFDKFLDEYYTTIKPDGDDN